MVAKPQQNDPKNEQDLLEKMKMAVEQLKPFLIFKTLYFALSSGLIILLVWSMYAIGYSFLYGMYFGPNSIVDSIVNFVPFNKMACMLIGIFLFGPSGVLYLLERSSRRITSETFSIKTFISFVIVIIFFMAIIIWSFYAMFISYSFELSIFSRAFWSNVIALSLITFIICLGYILIFWIKKIFVNKHRKDIEDVKGSFSVVSIIYHLSTTIIFIPIVCMYVYEAGNTMGYKYINFSGSFWGKYKYEGKFVAQTDQYIYISNKDRKLMIISKLTGESMVNY